MKTINKHESIYIHVKKSTLKKIGVASSIGLGIAYLILSLIWLGFKYKPTGVFEWWMPGVSVNILAIMAAGLYLIKHKFDEIDKNSGE